MMSSVSQTPDRTRLGFWPYFALTMIVVGLIVLLSMGPVSAYVMVAAARGQLHPPDLSLFAGLSTAVKIHLLTALAALLLGALLMVVRKGRAFHRAAGRTWVSLVAVTAGSSLFITGLNRGSWSLLHLLTGWTLLVLPFAVLSARRHKVGVHRWRMMGLFYGGFAINIFIGFIPGRTLWTMFFG
jgi:uncharacterized membrane protein